MKLVNKPLQNTLLINAGFSAISAISVLLFPIGIVTLMGLSDAFWLQLVAIGLVFFALLVSFVALQKTTNPLWVKLIIVQDVIWVIASILVLALQPWGLSMAGLLLIAAVAAVISLFAWLQSKYLSNGIN